MMSAYTVMDPVDKYRHGVLIGNFVQDKFGKDLNEKGPQPNLPKSTTTKTHHDLAHSLHQTNQFIQSQNKSNSQFYTTGRNINQPHLRPEQSTTYQIFHQQQHHTKVPILSNNPKKQQKLQENQLNYDLTRTKLGNNFTKPHVQTSINNSQEQIPDILTGQIFKPKVSSSHESIPNRSQTRIQSNVTPKSLNPYGVYSIIKPQIQRIEQIEYNRFVKPNPKGQQRDILFGHGIQINGFHHRQLATSYDLSFNQKVPPTTQINSFYQPKPSRQTTKDFFKNTEKQTIYNNPNPVRVQRPYQPYTSTFDANHKKHQYLRK